jgi:hypothetical protein
MSKLKNRQNLLKKERLGAFRRSRAQQFTLNNGVCFSGEKHETVTILFIKLSRHFSDCSASWLAVGAIS